MHSTTASRVVVFIAVAVAGALCAGSSPGAVGNPTGPPTLAVPKARPGYWPTVATAPKNAVAVPWQLAKTGSRISVAASNYHCADPVVATVAETTQAVTIHIYAAKNDSRNICADPLSTTIAYVKTVHPLGQRTINVDAATGTGT
ncbi:MAG TPA: hypothetical protein VHX59_02450 [Mycobacteriales bacterium]|jgi:hypothetical protein|nr:hypothetical protein [Mycobacteriales bacterium]